ncbi:MAG: hypothetical protein AAFY11_11675, partial [Cyanobacteria bacterium J06641_5]
QMKGDQSNSILLRDRPSNSISNPIEGCFARLQDFRKRAASAMDLSQCEVRCEAASLDRPRPYPPLDIGPAIGDPIEVPQMPIATSKALSKEGGS